MYRKPRQRKTTFTVAGPKPFVHDVLGAMFQQMADAFDELFISQTESILESFAATDTPPSPPHTARHTHATRLLGSGVPLNEVEPHGSSQPAPRHRPERDANDPNAFTNPTLLVEVLSPHTADYDRGEKFVHYRSLPSLQEYVIVSIEERRVERHRRLDTGDWLMTERRDGNIELASIGVILAVDPPWSDLETIS